MKNWKSIIITVFSFFAIGSMVFFNSCVKDPCTELKCKNGGSCSDGFCQCPTGYEGAECETTAASRFVGVWVGNFSCNNYPISVDTVRIELQEAPNTIRLKLGSGNTSIFSFTGTAATPETHFDPLILDQTTVRAYVTVDGGLLQLYEQTINDQLQTRQNCRFSGRRISN